MQVDLPNVLPGAAGAEDPRVRRLVASIGERQGVRRAHVIEAAFGEPGKLCVHLDPDKTDRSRLREMIEKTGARLTNQFGNATWTTPPISGPGNADQAAEMLGRITGVVVAEVEPGRRIQIEYDREQIQKAELRGMLALMGAQKGECSNE